ncbi:MAG: sugar ABC transporter permease [Nitriliruptoraceae bacterium]|nr:sugar ABC transporter permease [Nitriliruptoraceae bacterium]
MTSTVDTGVPPTAAAEAPPPPRRRWRLHSQRTAPFLFIAPFMVAYLLFFFAPLVYALNISLYRQRLIGGDTFVGLENYARVFRDATFYTGLARITVYGLLYLAVMLVIALTAALLLDSGTVRFKRFFRLSMFLPYAVPSAVAALMWGYIYSRNFGPIADVARLAGFDAPNLLSSRAMIPSLVNIGVWTWVGYNMIIFYTALQAVPHEVNEAADVDGATRLQIAWHIKLPLIRPAIILSVFFSIIGALQLFNEPQVLSAIAPQVIDPAYTPNLYAYSLAFVNQDFPYSAAVSFVLGAAAFISSYVFMAVTQKRNQ